jgi:hypothetical protein
MGERSEAMMITLQSLMDEAKCYETVRALRFEPSDQARLGCNPTGASEVSLHGV